METYIKKCPLCEKDYIIKNPKEISINSLYCFICFKKMMLEKLNLK